MVNRIVLLLGFLLAASADAQDSHLREGQRVRISERNLNLAGTGTIVALKGDTLFFRADRNGITYTILHSDLATLDTSKGSRDIGPGALGGAVIGLGVGALGGSLVSKLLIENRKRAHNQCPDGNCEFSELVAIPLGALIGLAVGAGIGSELRGERWEEVPLSLRAAASPVGPRRLTLALEWQPSWLTR